MDTSLIRKTHPMVVIAAVAITLFSLVGSAAILGLIPTAHSERMESSQLIADNSGQQPAEAAQPATAPKEQTQSKPASSGSSHYTSKSRPVLVANADDKQTVTCRNCGVIESIRLVQHEGDGSGLGAVAGGVTGGLVGNQIGQGKGNVLMTLLGIGGGAYAGNTIEKKMKASASYLVKVRMEDGTYRTINQTSQPEYAVGDHVRITSGHLTLA